ncbi:MAG: hypothetical protein WKF77_00645 [Planctomycetaceae bacterium]
MNNDTETVKQMPDRTLYGKVIGVVKFQYQLTSLCDSLAILGVREVEVLNGDSGTKRLETWKETVSQYFFGDMEGEMLQQYLDAVANDLFVFAAAVVPELADKAAEIAKMNGASQVVHFGNSTVTNY